MILPQENIILPEIWMCFPYIAFPEVKRQYSISNYGRLYNHATQTYLPQNIDYDKDKYITISLSANNDKGHIYQQIHRLVCITFNPIPNYNLYDVNHKDGVKYHNWAWNLEWVTKSENIQHALNNDLFKLGEDRLNTKIPEFIIIKICEMIQSGLKTSDIVKVLEPETKMYTSNLKEIVNNIKGGYSWTHISRYYDFSNAAKKERFSENDIRNICKLFEKYGVGISSEFVLDNLNIDKSGLSRKELNCYSSAISSIRKKKTFKNICDQYDY